MTDPAVTAVPEPAATLLVRDHPTADAAAALAPSVELLRAVADGGIVDDRVVRVYTPPPTVAMSRRESHMPGFAAASAAARRRGFTPVVRPTGGRAVAYDASCVVFDLVVRESREAGPQALFARVGAALATMLGGFGVDARVGDVPGEYCPGEFSVNARGAVKLIGTSQRSVRGARLLSGMLPLGSVAGLVDVLADVNAALGLTWDAATFGTLRREAPHAARAAVEDALAGALIDLPPSS